MRTCERWVLAPILKVMRDRHHPPGSRKIFLIPILFAALVFALPAKAQEADDSAPPPAVQDDTGTMEERLALSRQMHEIWPIRPRVEEALDQVGANLDLAKAPKIRAALRRAIKYDQLEEESVQAMADIFTAPELEAMIAFYGSPEGQAIAAKTSEYEAALRPALTEMLDKASMDIRMGAE